MFANTASVSNNNPYSVLSVRQFIRQNITDNKAPEAAGVILEELEKQGFFIKQAVLAEQGIENCQALLVEHILTLLNSNPDYALFCEKFALQLSKGQSTRLDRRLLTEAGIETVEQLQDYYTKLLVFQKKLTRTIPDFNKIKDTDDYIQVLDYLANNPLFGKFLKVFTQQMADSYNQNHLQAKINPPVLIDKSSLALFFKQVGMNAKTADLREKYQHFMQTPESQQLKWAYLPGANWIKNTINQFYLHQWITRRGNLETIQMIFMKKMSAFYQQDWQLFAKTIKTQFPDSELFAAHIDEIVQQLDKILTVVVTSESNSQGINVELDHQLENLFLHLTWVKHFYQENPLQRPGDNFPSTAGHFEDFVKKMLFNVTTSPVTTALWQGEQLLTLDLMHLVNSIIEGGHRVSAKINNGKGEQLLVEDNGSAIPPLTVLRDQIKILFTSQIQKKLHQDLSEKMHERELAESSVLSDIFNRKEGSAIEQQILSAMDFGIIKPGTLAQPIEPFPAHSTESHARIQTEAHRQFNMRHVMGLSRFTEWSSKDWDMQIHNNRILQEGFMEGDLSAQLTAIKIAQEAWLTDVLIPVLDTALLLHTAARLFTDYQIDTDSVNDVAQRITADMLRDHGIHLATERLALYTAFNHSIDNPLYQECLLNTKSKMEGFPPDSPEYTMRFEAYMQVEKNKLLKRENNALLAAFLDTHFLRYANNDQLKPKPIFPLADTRDYVFLGAAASGKSTISNQYFPAEEKKRFVTLATDDYRGICRPFTDKLENENSEQIFIRTQDSAFLVNEIVLANMRAKTVERPNIIVDGIIYKPECKAFVEQNNQSVLVFACLDDMGKVVQRTYDRAIQEDASVADKGRHVNTTDLITAHKYAGINLFKYCDNNIRMDLYNTNIPRGDIPPRIANIDTREGKVLNIMSQSGAFTSLVSFLNKSRVNPMAQSGTHLFFNKVQKPQYQVDSLFSILDLKFTIRLCDNENQPCLSVKKDNQGPIQLDILNLDGLRDIYQTAQEAEKNLLAMFLIYAKLGDLKSVNQYCLLYQDKTDEVLENLFGSNFLSVIPTGKPL